MRFAGDAPFAADFPLVVTDMAHAHLDASGSEPGLHDVAVGADRNRDGPAGSLIVEVVAP